MTCIPARRSNQSSYSSSVVTCTQEVNRERESIRDPQSGNGDGDEIARWRESQPVGVNARAAERGIYDGESAGRMGDEVLRSKL